MYACFFQIRLLRLLSAPHSTPLSNHALPCLHLFNNSPKCDSPEYRSFELYAVLSVFVYQSIPLIWLRLLWKYKDKLNPPRLPQEVALRDRAMDKDLRVLSFLWAGEANWICFPGCPPSQTLSMHSRLRPVDVLL